MKMMLSTAWVVLLTTGLAHGATVTFELFATDDPSADQVTVLAGDPVAYTLTVTVTSDDPGSPDSDGLAGFSVDLLTDLGIAQLPADEFGVEIVASFPLFPSLGSPIDPSDLLGISAFSEALLGGTGTPGIALDETITLATGSFLTDPDMLGTFTIMFGDIASGSVLLPDAGGFIDADTVVLGPALTIVTQGPDDDMTGTDDSTGVTDDTGTTPEIGPVDPFSSPLAFFFTIFGFVGIVAALIIAIGLSAAAGAFF